MSTDPNIQQINSQTLKANSFDTPFKKRRRTRHNFQGETFDCKCGKVYLSLPALHFHLKTKHKQGQSQHQKIETSFSNVHPFGKKKLESDQGRIFFTKDDKEKLENAYELSLLGEYLDKFLDLEDLNGHKKIENNTILGELEVRMTDFWRQNEKEKQVLRDGLFQTSLIYVFGLFLNKLKSSLKDQYHNLLTQILLSLHFEINQWFQNPTYTQTNSASSLPFILNQILPNLYTKHYWNVGMEEKTKNVTCIFLLFLCRWLELERFTDTKLKLNLA